MKYKIKDITGYPIRNLFGQMLMTQEILNRLPEWGASSDSRVHELKAVAHYFGGGFDAWLVEFHPQTGKCFGFVRIRGLDDGELGYFSIQEMLQPMKAKVPVTVCEKNGIMLKTCMDIPIVIERDSCFKPRLLIDVEEIANGDSYVGRCARDRKSN